MFIAHMPAAYLACRALPLPRPAFRAGMLGGIAPDIDLFWFAFVDHGARCTRRRYSPPLVSCISCSTVGPEKLHGKIARGWPISDAAQPLVVVPTTHDFWVWSFLAHWSFLPEIALCAAAALLWHRRPNHL